MSIIDQNNDRQSNGNLENKIILNTPDKNDAEINDVLDRTDKSITEVIACDSSSTANESLKLLRALVNISDEELREIATNLVRYGATIQLLDYIDQIGLSEDLKREILETQQREIPQERKAYFGIYKSIIASLRTTEHNLSQLRLNPFTQFENHPPLYFGMGGGSKRLCKALPFDVLGMLLTGETLKRKLRLRECRILLANRITYTNIPNNPEFSQESIDNVMRGERDLLQLVIDKFGFENWRIFLQTDVEDVVGKDIKDGYEDLIEKADRTNLVGGHHYSIEMADIWALVGQQEGGIKLGWFIRNLDKENRGYIMDEQPFHARFNLFMALQGIRNNTTLAYAKAGSRLFPGPTGTLEKESPYICYQPHNRLLLSPFEQPIDKLRNATQNNGGFQYKYFRNLMSGIIELFEDLVLDKDIAGIPNRIHVPQSTDFRGSQFAHKIRFILQFIFDGEKEAEKIWRKTFPNATP